MHSVFEVVFCIASLVYPESTEDVSKIVKVCNDFHFPIVPFGGGTSIEGHTLALQGGLSLDMNRMKAILALNEKDLDIHLQAGVGYIELNEMLRDKGLWCVFFFSCTCPCA